jgi:hypothetical protein
MASLLSGSLAGFGLAGYATIQACALKCHWLHLRCEEKLRRGQPACNTKSGGSYAANWAYTAPSATATSAQAQARHTLTPSSYPAGAPARRHCSLQPLR